MRYMEEMKKRKLDHAEAAAVEVKLIQLQLLQIK